MNRIIRNMANDELAGIDQILSLAIFSQSQGFMKHSKNISEESSRRQPTNQAVRCETALIMELLALCAVSVFVKTGCTSQSDAREKGLRD